MTDLRATAPLAAELLTEVLVFAQRYPSTRTFAVLNPADGAHLADVPDLGPPEAEAAIAAAKAAFAPWAARTAIERAALLRRWHGLILERKEALGQLLTLEQGKPDGRGGRRDRLRRHLRQMVRRGRPPRRRLRRARPTRPTAG
jgi:acyl-CoA reductase-like NAD-dependent aldehyde dehydrogenase